MEEVTKPITEIDRTNILPELTELEKKAIELSFIVKQKKLLEDQEKILKAEIMPLVKAEDKSLFDNDFINIKYRCASTGLTFDTTRFQKDQPELYVKYKDKVRKTSESLVVKLKEGKEDEKIS